MKKISFDFLNKNFFNYTLQYFPFQGCAYPENPCHKIDNKCNSRKPKSHYSGKNVY